MGTAGTGPLELEGAGYFGSLSTRRETGGWGGGAIVTYLAFAEGPTSRVE